MTTETDKLDADVNGDKRHLETLESKMRLLGDRVRSVANGYQTAAYIVGRPGIGKTYTVLDELNNKNWGPWAMRNARMTPLGLFRFFAEHPHHTLVLDDVGGLFDMRLDLRCLAKATRDYLQWRDGNADTPWRDLVRSTLRKLADAELVPLISKHQEIEEQRQRIRQLLELYPDDTERQLRDSGLSKSTFYARRREVLLGR